jgi:hypothetical protein
LLTSCGRTTDHALKTTARPARPPCSTARHRRWRTPSRAPSTCPSASPPPPPPLPRQTRRTLLSQVATRQASAPAWLARHEHECVVCPHKARAREGTGGRGLGAAISPYSPPVRPAVAAPYKPWFAARDALGFWVSSRRRRRRQWRSVATESPRSPWDYAQPTASCRWRRAAPATS